MYEPYFRLLTPAFSTAPDPRFLWLSQTHGDGLEALCSGIVQREGVVILTGDVGSGKTTLLRAALRRAAQGDMDSASTALVVSPPGLGSPDLLKLVAAQFWLGANSQNADEQFAFLEAFLIERQRSGRRPILAIDEAQNLLPDALETLSQLANLEADGGKLLQIVLVGQPGLRDALLMPDQRALRRRIAVEHYVEPLEADEIGLYLRHRIEVACGRYEEVFAPGVDRAIAAFCFGCPRLLNLLADRVLLAAYVKRERPVTAALVERKARELAAARAAPLPKNY